MQDCYQIPHNILFCPHLLPPTEKLQYQKILKPFFIEGYSTKFNSLSPVFHRQHIKKTHRCSGLSIFV